MEQNIYNIEIIIWRKMETIGTKKKHMKSQPQKINEAHGRQSE